MSWDDEYKYKLKEQNLMLKEFLKHEKKYAKDLENRNLFERIFNIKSKREKWIYVEMPYRFDDSKYLNKEKLSVIREIKMKDKLFIVPNNDAESMRIIEILENNKEKFLVTSQAWGASWDNLEDNIKKEIHEVWKQYQLGVATRVEIYGIELQGKTPNILCENIDHHTYANDDRANKLSSLEQVLNLINIQETSWDKYISANDTGYIPAMEKAGASDILIQQIRALDRKAQGVTAEQEKQASEAIEKLEKYEDLTVIRSIHSKCSIYTDKLYSQYKNLLILSEDGESNFYGDAEIVEKLFQSFQGWKGGNLEEGYGFWGGYASQEEIEKLVIKETK